MHQQEIALWGKLTAGITHEMKNVLAIVNEYTGLMRDIMTAERQTPLKHQDKLFRAMEKISQQVYRGGEIADNLNRFAHSTDEARANVELNGISSQVSFLLKRFAGQREVDLEVLPAEGAVKLYTNPFRLILTLAGITYHLLDITTNLKKITLKPVAQARYVQFEISLYPCPDKSLEGVPEADQFFFLDDALKDLDSELEPLGPAGFIVKIAKPKA